MTLVLTYATGVGALIAVVLGWIAVQSAWRRMFPDRLVDVDPMVGRLGCGGCRSTEPCVHRNADHTCRREEER